MNTFIKGIKLTSPIILIQGQQFLIDTVIYSSRDSNIAEMLIQNRERSLLKQGKPLDGSTFELEKERISNMLRNRGYAYFYSNFIPALEADTTVVSKKVQVYLNVLPPPQDSVHKKYRVGEIRVFPNFDPTIDTSSYRDTIIQDLMFVDTSFVFPIKPSTIANNIYLKSGATYNEEAFVQTNKNLSGLGIFSFVRIRFEPNEDRPDELDFRIELTPVPKIEVGIDFELNYTNRSTSTTNANLLGISARPYFQNKNLFGGAEQLISNLSAGVEVNPNSSGSRFWNTIDLNLQSNLYLSKFTDYLGIWRKLNRFKTGKESKLVSDNFYNSLSQSASTRLTASYNFLFLLDFYRYNFLNISYGYDFQKNSNHRYLINHLAIDYLRPTIEPDFQTILDANQFLENSFGEQLFVSLLFRDFNYVKRSRTSRSGESHFVGFSAEVAGAEIWAGNKIYNTIANKEDTLSLGSIDFSQYVKLELGLRYYRQTASQATFATRFNFGIARPFGFTTNVPYVKQFFVGGPNSIRAWAARGLGPGSHTDSLTFNNNNRLLFYQTGDLKLEFNLEYRFNIYWRLKGALFLDAGNIWTIAKDPDRIGSQFLLSRKPEEIDPNFPGSGEPFYRQIAVGGGFGFRFDFTYFIFRIDLGLQLRNPFPRLNADYSYRERDFWNPIRGTKLSDFNLNIGLGYPF